MAYPQKYYLLYLLCLFNILLKNKSFGQREIILKRTLIVDCLHPTYFLERCNYGLLIPANRPGKQEIIKYTYPYIKPNHFDKTENSEYYLIWKNISFPELKKNNMEVSIKIKLHTYDLKTAKKHPVKDTTDKDTLNYLKDEENFRINAKNIKEAASKLNGNDREEIVKNIFNYVTGSLDYHIFFDQDRGAKKALKEGKGDCTEYAELMVTLCRAKKIPARIIMGLIPRSTGEIGYHNWVEVYFPEYDWVAFDPTWADHPKATTTFYSMKNTYVQLSTQRYVRSIVCPCREAFPFSIKLKDTCIDLSKDMSKKIKEMLTCYNNNDLIKAGALLDTLLTHEPDNYSFWTLKGILNARLLNFDKGYECLQNSIKNAESKYEKTQCLYAFSNFYALKNDSESAVKYLREAVDLGFDNYKHVSTDVDFTKIKDYPPFIELLNELKTKEEKKEH